MYYLSEIVLYTSSLLTDCARTEEGIVRIGRDIVEYPISREDTIITFNLMWTGW